MTSQNKPMTTTDEVENDQMVKSDENHEGNESMPPAQVVEPETMEPVKSDNEEKVNAVAALEKNKLFVKIFSQHDEIVILERIAAFWANGRKNDWVEFYRFVKDDLPGFKYSQVYEKQYEMRRKFGRIKARGGLNHLPPDSHEARIFELSKTLWDNDVITVTRKKRKRGNDKENKMAKEKKIQLIGEGEALDIKEEWKQVSKEEILLSLEKMKQFILSLK